MKIFVNFSARDALVVDDNLVVSIHALGHEVAFRLPLETPYRAALLAELKTSELFVYALTPASVKDPWCVWLYRQAVVLGKPVLPVQTLAGATPPEFARFVVGITDVTESPLDFSLALGSGWNARRMSQAEITLSAPPPTGIPPQKAALKATTKGVRARMLSALQKPVSNRSKRKKKATE